MSNLKNEIAKHIVLYFNKEINGSGFFIDFDQFKSEIFSTVFKKDDFELKFSFCKVPEDVVIINNNIGMFVSDNFCSVASYTNNSWHEISFSKLGLLLSSIEDFADLSFNKEKNNLDQKEKEIVFSYINYIFDSMELNAKT